MSELATVTANIHLPGCKILRNGLQIERGLAKETLEEIGRTLSLVEQSALWWWGDYLCHVEAEWGETYAEAAAKSSYSYSTLRNAKWLSSKLKLSYRRDKLSYTHHLEALSECGGDALKAHTWLMHAEQEGWSISAMRAAIRLAQKDPDTEQPTHEPQQSPYDIVKNIKSWWRTVEAAATPEIRQRVKEDLIEFANQL